MWQYFNINKQVYMGKILTLAVKVDGELYAGSVEVIETTSAEENVIQGNGFTAVIKITASGDNSYVEITPLLTTPVIVEWAAIYEGEYTAENLPPYVPKGYAVELAECMRYYRLLKIGGAVNGNYIGYRIPISPTMRTNPTVERSQIGTSSGQTVITAGGYTSESISLRLDAYIESTTEKWWTDDVVLSADL